MPEDEEQIAQDYAKVIGDVLVAVLTGREPEDVQRERHDRERAEVEAFMKRTRWPRRSAQ